MTRPPIYLLAIPILVALASGAAFFMDNSKLRALQNENAELHIALDNDTQTNYEAPHDSATDDADEMSLCCKAKAQQQQDTEAEDDGCSPGDCSNGCNCICCGSAVVQVVQRTAPVQVALAPRAASVTVRSSSCLPQDVVCALFHPPQA